jgi:hypothetical protein
MQSEMGRILMHMQQQSQLQADRQAHEMREARRLQAEAQDRQEEAQARQARYFETQSAANAATALQHTAALAPLMTLLTGQSL